MKIEIATKQDVPALLDLQRKAFGPLCEALALVRKLRPEWGHR